MNMKWYIIMISNNSIQKGKVFIMINEVIIAGNLTADPMIYSRDERKMATFSICVNVAKDKPEYHDIVAYNKLAEIIEKYFKKGYQIHVVGTLRNTTSEKDGKKYYNRFIVAEKVMLLRVPGKAAANEEKKEELPEVPFDFPND